MLKNFRERWAQKAKRPDYLEFSDEKMLRNVGLLTDQGLNCASLILFGKKEKIDQLLPGSEIIFEWRHSAKKISHDYRINWREPFFKIYDEVWETINARNLRIPFQVRKNKKGVMKEFQDVFPELKPMDISNLLRELKRDGKIARIGPKNTGHWELVKNTFK